MKHLEVEVHGKRFKERPPKYSAKYSFNILIWFMLYLFIEGKDS